MKIFYNLQLSFIDKNGKFLLNKDSNFSVFYNIAKGFAKYYPEYNFFTIIPKESIGSEILKELPNVIYKRVDTFTKRIFSSRFQWYSDMMSQVITYAEPDLIWENNPTLVNNWKTLLIEDKLIEKTKVLTYNHWIDSPWYAKTDNRAPYFIRQCEGAYYADKILCNSEEASTQIVGCVSEILPWAFDRVVKNIDTLAPYIDDETLTAIPSTREDAAEYNIIYNHRLSSLPYYDKPYKLFLEAVEQLKEFKVLQMPFKIHFTDASGKLSSRDDIPVTDSNNVKLFLHNNLAKNEYWDLLSKMDVCVGSFLDGYGGAWSISLAEGILAGCNTIVPNHSGYKEMVPEDYEFLLTFSDPRELKSLILEAAISEPNTTAKEFYLKNYSMKVLSTKLDKILHGMFTKNS
jgi:hypothetical protein